MLKPEVGPGARLQSRSWTWIADWPVASAAAAPPPLASGGASQHFHQQALHFALREPNVSWLAQQFLV